MKNSLQIAIDGPVGAGKSDISKRLAEKLGILYLYTGVMYRAVTYVCMREGIDISDEQAVAKRLSTLYIELRPTFTNGHPWVHVFVKGEHTNVTHDLFDKDVEKATPTVAAYKAVRQEMVKRQQQIAAGQNVVAEGRDIGLRVLPNAQLKIYLTATLEERAKRRFNLMRQDNQTITYEQVLEETIRRDEADMIRVIDPLRKLPDAWELDSTGMTQDEVVNVIKKELMNRHLL